MSVSQGCLVSGQQLQHMACSHDWWGPRWLGEAWCNDLWPQGSLQRAKTPVSCWSTLGLHQASQGLKGQEVQWIQPLSFLPCWTFWGSSNLSFSPWACHPQDVGRVPAKDPSSGHPNLIVAFAWDAVTAVCLLQELHSKDSLRCLPMELKSDVCGKATKKLSFCLFCLYHSSNNLSYMNHIMCGHFHANYGWKTIWRYAWASPRLVPPPHLRRSLCPRVPRRAPRQACTIASIQRRRNWTLPRGQAGKVSSPRHTRSPNNTRRCLRRRSITGGTKQTRASLPSPTRSESHGWCTSNVHPFTALCTKDGASVIPKVFQL